MLEFFAAIVGPSLAAILSWIILPIRREARRLGPHEALPDQYTSNSLSRIIFRFFQWIYWGDVQLFQGVTALLEDRIKRPRGTSSHFAMKAEGVVIRYDPMPIFRSLYVKIPIVWLIFLGVYVGAGVIFVPIAGYFIGTENAWNFVGTLGRTLFILFGASLLVFFVLASSSMDKIAVIRHDTIIKLNFLNTKPLERYPQFRLNDQIDAQLKSKALFGSVCLVEMSLDGGLSWQDACRAQITAFKLSCLIEGVADWRQGFQEFSRLLAEDAAEMAAANAGRARPSKIL